MSTEHDNQNRNDELLTGEQLAPILKVSPRTIVTRRQNGDIPCVRIGRSVRFFLPDVIAHLRRRSPKL